MCGNATCHTLHRPQGKGGVFGHVLQVVGNDVKILSKEGKEGRREEKRQEERKGGRQGGGSETEGYCQTST